MAGENSGNDAFEEFQNAGEVEVGDTNAAPKADDEAEKPKPKPRAKPAEKPAAAKLAAADEAGEGDEEGDAGEGDDEAGEGEGEGKEKPKKTQTPSERIRELNKRLRNSERLRLADQDRLTAIEQRLQNGGLPAAGGAGNTDAVGEAPDPQDTAKYPLGHLDDRYIEDKLEWLATKKATERADAVLQRQQEGERSALVQREQTALLEKVDDLATRGSELYDDFQESVVDTGMKGDWPLSQATFEAAHEATHGAQILYELSQDKKEAARVAGLSAYQQLKFVGERDAAIEAEKPKPRTKPGAGEPPATQTRGASSKSSIKPDTDNLDDFEKAWKADAKKGRS